MQNLSYTNYINDLKSVADILGVDGLLKIELPNGQDIKIDVEGCSIHYTRVIGASRTHTVSFNIKELIDKSNDLGDVSARGILLTTMERVYNLVNIKFRLTMGEIVLKSNMLKGI